MTDFSFFCYVLMVLECLNQQDLMSLIEKLRNFPRVKEVKTEIFQRKEYIL